MNKNIYIFILLLISLGLQGVSNASTGDSSTTYTQQQITSAFNSIMNQDDPYNDIDSLVLKIIFSTQTEKEAKQRIKYLVTQFEDLNQDDTLTTWAIYQQFSTAQKKKVQGLLNETFKTNNFAGTSISDDDYNDIFSDDFWNNTNQESSSIIATIIDQDSKQKAINKARTAYNELSVTDAAETIFDNPMDLALTTVEIYDYYNVFTASQKADFMNKLDKILYKGTS